MVEKEGGDGGERRWRWRRKKVEMAEKEEDNKPRSIHVKATKKIKIGKKNNNTYVVT